jgi:hypothetical protein
MNANEQRSLLCVGEGQQGTGHARVIERKQTRSRRAEGEGIYGRWENGEAATTIQIIDVK